MYGEDHLKNNALIFFLAFSINGFLKVEKQKEPHYKYLTLSTSVYTNAIGTFNQKAFFSAEAGKYLEFLIFEYLLVD